MANKNYATIGDFELALKRAKDGLPSAVETALRQNVPSLVDKIKLRVSTTGINGNNVPFSTPYSRSHAYKRKTKGKDSLGTQTDYKGFYFQGTMWDNFKLLAFNTTDIRITAKLGFVGSNVYLTNERLNEIHSDREHIAIGQPNLNEGAELTRLIGKSIGDYLNSVL